MAEGTSSEPAMGPDEKQIRDEVKKRSHQIDIEEIWVLPSGERLRRSRFQATIENAYLEEVETVPGRSVANLEERCRLWFDLWDEREVKRRTCDAEYERLLGEGNGGARRLELLKRARPRRGWSEGFVDQSELHILVRSGGTEIRANEPEGIDVAVVGPDENEQLIVEFLPMIGVDPEAGQAAKDRAFHLFELMARGGRGDPWSYAKHHCNTGANLYSLVRFAMRDGRKPVQPIILRHIDMGNLVGLQAPLAEHVGKMGRTVLKNRGDGCRMIEVEHCGESSRGLLLGLTYDTVTVRLWSPEPAGGTMRRKIFAPYERGYLVDDIGYATDYGLELMGELVSGVAQASRKMCERLEDIQHCAAAVLDRRSAEEGPCPEQDLALQVWESLPGPPIDVDVGWFCNIVGEWLLFGLGRETRQQS